jgi:hypothetical protein
MRGSPVFIIVGHRASLGVWQIVLCLGATVSAPALAQSPRPRPSATVSIHQIQVAFIGSGMLGGGTLSYRGAPYRFRLGGLGIGIAPRRYWNNLRRLTDFEGVYEFAVGGLQATRAGVLCGCKMQMASICGWSACAAGYR